MWKNHLGVVDNDLTQQCKEVVEFIVCAGKLPLIAFLTAVLFSSHNDMDVSQYPILLATLSSKAISCTMFSGTGQAELQVAKA